MSISSSLNAGVMGLAVNSSRLSTISDNIANSATVGYKQSEVDFSSMVIAQGKGGYTAGGVAATAYKNVEGEGGLINTGNSTDIAISGRGMLMVTDASGLDAAPTARRSMLLPTGSFSPDADGFMQTSSGMYLMGWAANADGTIPNVSRNSTTSLEPVNIAASQFAAEPTNAMTLGVNLPAADNAAGATGDPYTLPVEYFNALGTAENLSFEFTPNPGTNDWTVNIFDSASATPATAIDTFTVTFDDAGGANPGTINAVAGAGYADGNITVTTASGEQVEVFIGEPGSRNGLTQFDTAYNPASVTKNGSPISELRSVEIDQNGMLQGVYESGARRTLFQIPVADVPNMNGLTALDGQAYTTSQASGSLYLWDAGTGSVGTTQGFTLMESTTDIASELTDLIETQRAYSTNAKIIQTVDEMLQETTNLKR